MGSGVVKIRTNRCQSASAPPRKAMRIVKDNGCILSANFLLDVNLMFSMQKFYDVYVWGLLNTKRAWQRSTATDGALLAHYNLDLHHLSHHKTSHESQVGSVHYRTTHKGIRLINVCSILSLGELSFFKRLVVSQGYISMAYPCNCNFTTSSISKRFFLFYKSRNSKIYTIFGLATHTVIGWV